MDELVKIQCETKQAELFVELNNKIYPAGEGQRKTEWRNLQTLFRPHLPDRTIDESKDILELIEALIQMGLIELGQYALLAEIIGKINGSVRKTIEQCENEIKKLSRQNQTSTPTVEPIGDGEKIEINLSEAQSLCAPKNDTDNTETMSTNIKQKETSMSKSLRLPHLQSNRQDFSHSPSYMTCNERHCIPKESSSVSLSLNVEKKQERPLSQETGSRCTESKIDRREKFLPFTKPFKQGQANLLIQGLRCKASELMTVDLEECPVKGNEAKDFTLLVTKTEHIVLLMRRGNIRCIIYDIEGKCILQLEKEKILNPMDVTNWSNGKFVLTDAGNGNYTGIVVVVDAIRNTLRKLVSGLALPVGIDADDRDNTYICDMKENSVMLYTNLGFLARIIRRFQHPMYVSVGMNNEIFVTNELGINSYSISSECITWLHRGKIVGKCCITPCGCVAFTEERDETQTNDGNVAMSKIFIGSSRGFHKQLPQNLTYTRSGMSISNGKGKLATDLARKQQQLKLAWYNFECCQVNQNHIAFNYGETAIKSIEYCHLSTPTLVDTSTVFEEKRSFDISTERHIYSTSSCIFQRKLANPVKQRGSFGSRLQRDQSVVKESMLSRTQGSLDNALLFLAESPYNDFENLSSIYLLLSLGANVNVCDEGGNTALYLAIRAQKEMLVRLLLAHGASSSLTNKQNYSGILISNTSIIKALTWHITRIFVKTHKHALPVAHVWPGYTFRRLNYVNDSIARNNAILTRIPGLKSQANFVELCKDCLYTESGKIGLCLVVYTELKIENVKLKVFENIPIEYRYPEIKHHNESVTVMNHCLDRSMVYDKQHNAPFQSVPGKIIENLFRKHSNLTMISGSAKISRRFKPDCPHQHELINDFCVVLYTLVKGIIPVGEEEFPNEIYGLPTDVREGYCVYSAKPGGFNLGFGSGSGSGSCYERRNCLNEPALSSVNSTDLTVSGNNSSATCNQQTDGQGSSLAPISSVTFSANDITKTWHGIQSNRKRRNENENHSVQSNIKYKCMERYGKESFSELPCCLNQDTERLLRNQNSNSFDPSQSSLFLLPHQWPTLGAENMDWEPILDSTLKLGSEIYVKNDKLGGTLGGFVSLNDEEIGILTCAHVLRQDKMTHRNKTDVLYNSIHCGHVSKSMFSPGNPIKISVDAAIIRLNLNTSFRNSFIGDTPYKMYNAGYGIFDELDFDTGEVVADINGIKFGEHVIKVGAASGTTRGRMNYVGTHVRINREFPINNKGDIFYGQAEIYPSDSENIELVARGDSGSLAFIVDQTSRCKLKCIGMLIAMTSYGSYIITPIRNVLDSLGLPLSFKRF